MVRNSGIISVFDDEKYPNGLKSFLNGRKGIEMKRKNITENMMQGIFLLSACVSIIAVILICFFIFANGLPAIFEIGAGNFVGGTKWKPLEGLFGILPMIVGSIYVTAGAIVMGVPIGILCAVFMAKFCPGKIYKGLKPAIELLAGIPPIVYGFCGLVVLVPIIGN